MHLRLTAFTLAVAAVPAVALAQPAPATPVSNTAAVAQAFRNDASRVGRNLIAAAETMPADKYGYKPTPAQMSFGDVVAHLIEGNDYLCGMIGGVQAPQRSKVTGADSKDALVARLKETFQFCDDALAKIDDNKLNEPMTLFGSMKTTRAGVMTLTTGDWADHYSQAAIYLRLNGQLPPTAKKQ
jgi:uncharacterized damage-inducible protein DinB